ncbi:MAG: hypothetical protein H7Y31_12400 [Chitinophagaceae bacterium]|nr:hypothetical protein [Chitinophagaceae bacterium]
MTRKLTSLLIFCCITIYSYAQQDSVVVNATDTSTLVKLVTELAAKESNPLLKRHFNSVATIAQDKSHGFSFGKDHIAMASSALVFFRNEGSKWETYRDGPRPLMMSFKSKTDGKNSFYWFFLPKNFDPKRNNYPLYVELHGSGGGSNNNPRQMLLHPLQKKIEGVTEQGYRKEGIFILPWGRGDKGYRDTAAADIFECLQDVDSMFKTDATRQYLYGFSMGGAGSFRIAQQSINRWAAIGMYSAAFRSVAPEEAKAFVNTPVWMAWGETESWAVNDRILKDYLLKEGVKLQWTEVKGVGHNYLGEYQRQLMDWLKQQVKPSNK